MTNILIDYLRDSPIAVAYLDALPNPLFLSAINVAELYAGVRDGQERQQLDRFMLAFTILGVDHAAAALGGLWRRNYGKSHGKELADALIAALVHIHGVRLVTLNAKHFPMLPNVIIPY